MLSKDQIESYRHNGFVKVESLFSRKEVSELADDMVRIIEEWGEETIGWRGPWRQHYLEEEEELNTKAVFLHNPQSYSSAWGRSIFHEGLVSCVRDLVGDSVQWHHTVLHAKPPEKGTPFPMHQDYPFYPHDGPDFVDCLLHLDDAPFESGALQVVPGSHKGGPLEHNLGPDTAPHLPPENYHPDSVDTVTIPAKAGDVIFFSYLAIHWSDCNRTNEWRKAVRFGFHHTDMQPVGRAEDDPHRIDYDNILDRNDNTVVIGFRPNQDESRVGATGSVQSKEEVPAAAR
ncbi:MAG: phytanoyl-CoA dioxygenase family protein [Candidatus Latescibacterota bacterium]|nr:phytanoyl-CoA dioxygenase family protein [Candidatus Latescibacterota bacterium]